MTSEHLFEFSGIVPTISCGLSRKEICITALKTKMLVVLKLLKEHAFYRCVILSCISGVDFFEKQQRFLVAYEFLSVIKNFRIRLKLYTNEAQHITSSISIFINSNWWEREIWDLFGLFFDNHSDLRRILTDYGFEGYPMRKDFPLLGFFETSYNGIKKRVLSHRVQFSQEYRNSISNLSW